MSEFINYLQQHENQLRIVFSHLDQNKDGKFISIGWKPDFMLKCLKLIGNSKFLFLLNLGKICIDEVIAGFKKMGIMITENEAAALLHR